MRRLRDEEILTLTDIDTKIAGKERAEITEWAKKRDERKKAAEAKAQRDAKKKKIADIVPSTLEKMGVTINPSFKSTEPRFPLDVHIFRLIRLDPKDEKLRSLGNDNEIMKELMDTTTTLGEKALEPLKVFEPLDLHVVAPGLLKAMSLVIRYLVDAKPGLLIDYLVQQKALFNLLLWNSRRWFFDAGEPREPRSEMKLHSLINFDMDNGCTTTRDILECVVTFLNFAVSIQAPLDIVLHSVSLAALGYRSLLRENLGKYLNYDGDVRNLRLQDPSDFPPLPSREVIQLMVQLSSGNLAGNDGAAVALAFLRSCSKVELMRNPQPSDAMKELFVGMTAAGGGGQVFTLVRAWPQTRSDRFFLHGSTTDLRVLYLDLWVTIIESGVGVAGGSPSPEQQRVITTTAFDYFSGMLSQENIAIVRSRALRAFGLIMDRFMVLVDPRLISPAMDRLVELPDDDAFVGPRLAQLRQLHPRPLRSPSFSTRPDDRDRRSDKDPGRSERDPGRSERDPGRGSERNPGRSERDPERRPERDSDRRPDKDLDNRRSQKDPDGDKTSGKDPERRVDNDAEKKSGRDPNRPEDEPDRRERRRDREGHREGHRERDPEKRAERELELRKGREERRQGRKNRQSTLGLEGEDPEPDESPKATEEPDQEKEALLRQIAEEEKKKRQDEEQDESGESEAQSRNFPEEEAMKQKEKEDIMRQIEEHEKQARQEKEADDLRRQIAEIEELKRQIAEAEMAQSRR